MCLHIGKRVLARFQASILHVYVNNKNGAVATITGLVPGININILAQSNTIQGRLQQVPLTSWLFKKSNMVVLF